MKKIIPLILSLLVFFSCEENVEEPIPPLREIELNISYDGTIGEPPYQSYVAVMIYNKLGEVLFVEDFGVSYEEMISSNIINLKVRLKPDDYYIKVVWEWLNNHKIDSYDPTTEKELLQIKDEENISLAFELFDPEPTANKGWVEGRLYYNGEVEAFATVYANILNENFELIKVQALYGEDYNIDIRSFDVVGYITEEIDSGEYRIHSFWDINDNKKYDEGEPSEYSPLFVIYPGRPTMNIDIELK